MSHATLLVGVLYLVAALGSLVDLAANPLVLRTAVPALYSLRRLWLTGTLLAAVYLLIRAFRSTASTESRQQIGIVALGGVLSLVPFLTLSLLPDALLRQPLIPYEFSFLFLSLLPLAYGYAILHYRFVQLDRYVSRGAASALVLALLAGLYLVLSAVLMRLVPANLLQTPAANLVMILALAVLFHPLHRLLYIGVSRLFYGGWYDYRSAVQQISLATGRTGEPSILARTLSQEIQAAMQLEGACLLLREAGSDADVTTVVCASCARTTGAAPLRWELGGGLLEYFQNDPRPVEAEKLRRAVAGPRLAVEARPCLTCPYAQLWLPLPGREFPLGLLILGSKRGGGAFDTRDREILDVVARQAGIALQNACLITELEKRAQESAQLHRQVVLAREDERKRVARELHDQIIQPLVGLNFQLAETRAGGGWGTHGPSRWPKDEIQRVVDDVRRICADLRPPALDTLGLASAVRARVREVGRQASLQIRLTIEGDEERDLPEELSVCMYRVLQEALLNVQKHAAARQVRVGLRIGPDEVTLAVEDDGRGFDTPLPYNRLVGAGHFGLAGARERLTLVNGRLEISSTPPHGTRLVAQAPLAEQVSVSPTQREQ
ncbi:MAG: GAF domain-containing sensor histidine kinase [Anaerolineales bacterium]|nr:GAF domain-containing sensor histidine kinase [Anaerolineales bacterium]